MAQPEPEPISPATFLAYALGEYSHGVSVDLTDLEWAMLRYDLDFWLRPNQLEPEGDWLYWGAICGRGFGKSTLFTTHIHKGVAAGKYTKIALIAQDEDRSIDLQVNPLLETSPPWAKCELYKDDLYWPNGAVATIYSPEAPEKIRGFNGDLAWCSEFVGWARATRWDAWTNLATAIREGGSRILWDTTSKGRNEIIEQMMKLNEEDPETYPITRGAIWDNPALGRKYLRTQYRMYTGRRRAEELDGQVFREAEGALWQQSWIDDARLPAPPPLEVTLVSIDPATTTNEGSDATGLAVGGRRDGHVYVLRNRSGRLTPEAYAKAILEEHALGATGVIIETNRGGHTITSTIRAEARSAERARQGLPLLEVRVIDRDKPFPVRSERILWVKEIHSRGSKADRGAPVASCYEQGIVHHCGTFTDLEYQQTTYVAGTGESPNDYDAVNQLVTELLRLESNEPSPIAQAEHVADVVAAASEVASRVRAVRRARSVL